MCIAAGVRHQGSRDNPIFNINPRPLIFFRLSNMEHTQHDTDYPSL